MQGASDDFGNVYSIIKKQVNCPNIYGLGFGFQGYAEEYVLERIARLRASRESTSYDDVYGEIAYLNAITWYKRVYDSDSEVARLRHFVNFPSQVAMGFSMVGAEVHGMLGGMGAMSASAKSLNLDMLMFWTMTPLHLEEVEEAPTKIMGASDSQLEHMVLEDYYKVSAVSAVKLIQQAYVDAVPVRNGWVDSSLGQHIFMDGDVRIFNYVGRGRIEGGYYISGGLSGSGFAAAIGVDFEENLVYFVHGNDLEFHTSLTLLRPGEKFKDEGIAVIRVLKKKTDGTWNNNPAMSYDFNRKIGDPESFVCSLAAGNDELHYRLVLTGIPWETLTPGTYKLEVTVNPGYYVEPQRTASSEFEILKPIPIDALTFTDPSGNSIPYTAKGNIYIPVSTEVCVAGAQEFWIYTLAGTLKSHSGHCFSVGSPGEYRGIFSYVSQGSQSYGILRIFAVKVDIEAHQPGTIALPGAEMPEADEMNPMKLLVRVNDDNDDRGPLGSMDNADNLIRRNDDDIAKVVLASPGVNLGIMELTITPASKVQAFVSNALPLGGNHPVDCTVMAPPSDSLLCTVDLASPTGDLAGLATPGGVTLYIEGLAPAADVALQFAYKNIAGIEIAADEAHMGLLRIALNSGGSEVQDDGFAYISAAAQMPQLTARMQPESLSGSVQWRLLVEYNRNRTDKDYYLSETTWRTLDVSNPWDVFSDMRGEYRGGKAKFVSIYRGRQIEKVFHIRGVNPSKSTVDTELGANPWYLRPIARLESDYAQFNTVGTLGSTPGDYLACPNYGPPNGWGIMMLDPPPSAQELWNWKANIAEGKARLADPCRTEADAWIASQEAQQKAEEPTMPLENYVFTFNGVDFQKGTSRTPVDACTIQRYNGAVLWVIFWKNKTLTEPGSWQYRSSQYLDLVCGRMQ